MKATLVLVDPYDPQVRSSERVSLLVFAEAIERGGRCRCGAKLRAVGPGRLRFDHRKSCPARTADRVAERLGSRARLLARVIELAA
jgi:hypothetical protein